MVLALTELSDPDRFFREYSPNMYDLFTQSGGHIGVSGPVATRSWEVLQGDWPPSNKYVLINFMYTVDHAVKFLNTGKRQMKHRNLWGVKFFIYYVRIYV